MKTPEEKYNNDLIYHDLVNMIYAMIDKADLSPSEIREAAMYACIQYELRHTRPIHIHIGNTNNPLSQAKG